MKLVLEVLKGPHAGACYTFDQHETFLVGRDKAAHLALSEDRHFSRHHFLLEINPPNCQLRDLNSRNGTLVNGERVREAILKDGDIIAGGRTRLRVRVEQPPPPQPCLSCGQPTEMPTASYDSAGETLPAVCPACRKIIGTQPQPVPGYELIRSLGRGGMGEVWLARRLATNETVAVKLILPESVGSEKSIQLFLREVSVLSRLEHRRIVRFFEVGAAHGQFYFAMEFVPTVNLAELLAGSAAPSRIKTICAIGCQVLEALQFAHAEGFVHRDIKPANILVSRDVNRLRVKVADFGLAKNFENGGFSGMTRRGEIRGSLPYMPPEQIIDCRMSKPTVDIYGVGASLYQMLARRYPHDFPAGKDPYGVILDEEPVPLARSLPEAPSGLCELIHKAIARDAENRFDSAEEMRRALLPYARGTAE